MGLVSLSLYQNGIALCPLSCILLFWLHLFSEFSPGTWVALSGYLDDWTSHGCTSHSHEQSWVFFFHPDVSIWKILLWESCEHNAMNFCKPSLKLHWRWQFVAFVFSVSPGQSIWELLWRWWHLTLEHCSVCVLRTGIFFSVTTNHHHMQESLWWFACLISRSDDIQSLLLSQEPHYNNFLSLLFESCPVFGCLVSFSSFNPD